MSLERSILERQLRRQSLWLEDSWVWLFETRVLPRLEVKDGKPKALDVGCGPGFVMDKLSGLLEVKGADIDKDMVEMCRSRGLDVVQGDVGKLPFEARSFDIVYCSFLLLWLNDQCSALQEMMRVSRKFIICLAEPDFGGRIDYPCELSELTELIIKGIQSEGGDPCVGRKLRALFKEAGTTAEIGVHPGVWGIERLHIESDDEWRWIEGATERTVDSKKLEEMKSRWDRALEEGTMFQFNPVFYAIAEK